MSIFSDVIDTMRRDPQTDSVVPPSGFTAQLTIFSAGAMAFLAVFALALTVASGRLAARWGDELARTSTVRITAPVNEQAALTEKALLILQSTAGVSDVRALDAAEQQALLAPWFGTSLDLSTLPVPQLIEVIEDETGFDAVGLQLRLEAEVPGAVLDDHSTWRAPLVAAANRLRTLGRISALLLGLSVAAMVTLAANASLAANAQVIRVLRLVGATDHYIAQAFIRRFTLRALGGAAAGTVLGMVAVLILPAASENAGLLTGLGFSGAQWLIPLIVPLFAAGTAFAATRYAARRKLEELA